MSPVGRFLRGAPPRPNPPRGRRPPPELLAAADVYAEAVREYLNAVGSLWLREGEGVTSLLPHPRRVRAEWLPRVMRINESRPPAELAAEIASLARDLRAATPGQAEEAARRRAAEREEAEWEGQAYQLDAMPRRGAGGKLVWLYHGTSSALLPAILEEGLLADPPSRDEDSSVTPGYVYLALTAGRTDHYARKAAWRHGGDAVVLRLVVPWSWTEPDGDDEDIESGRWQRRVPFDVGPRHIFEVQGEPGGARRLRGPLRPEGDDAWARGFDAPGPGQDGEGSNL